jgi:hypothetical protein
MNLLLDVYNKNVGQRALFSEIIDIDFYDGPTEALCRLIDTEQWFVCSLVYIDFNKSERIFTLLEIDSEALLTFKSIFGARPSDQEDFYRKIKERVNDVYVGYADAVFLFKGDWLNAIKYELVKIPLKDLQYFNNIERVIEQTEESAMKWRGFFPPSS